MTYAIPRRVQKTLMLLCAAALFPASLHAAAPDLRVTINVPNAADAGAVINVSTTVKNWGAVGAGASFLKIYLSIDNLLDASDVELGGRAVPALLPTATDTAITPVMIPAGTPMGEHFILAQADADNVVAEGSEKNNVKAALIGIGPGPDLAAWTFAPKTACAGAEITLSDKTKNLGNVAAPASHTYYYLSTNNVFDAGDLLLGSRPVPALLPGDFNAGSIVVTLPSTLALKAYYVFAIADGAKVVAEIAESYAEFRKVLINCGPEICGDGIDNDGDGAIDEGCVEICGDGIDNDGDGLIDEGCVEICGDGIDNDGDGLVDEGCVTNPGTGTPGYWMNHEEAWPVNVITIGGIDYTKAEAIALMRLPVSGDKTLTMFPHLVSAKLNLLIGNDGSCIVATIADADAWMAIHPAGSGVSGDSAAWGIGAPWATRLDDYNNGRLCAPHRG